MGRDLEHYARQVNGRNITDKVLEFVEDKRFPYSGSPPQDAYGIALHVFSGLCDFDEGIEKLNDDAALRKFFTHHTDGGVRHVGLRDMTKHGVAIDRNDYVTALKEDEWIQDGYRSASYYFVAKNLCRTEIGRDFIKANPDIVELTIKRDKDSLVHFVRAGLASAENIELGLSLRGLQIMDESVMAVEKALKEALAEIGYDIEFDINGRLVSDELEGPPDSTETPAKKKSVA